MGQDLLVTSTEPDILRIQTPPPCIPRKRRGSPGEALRNRGGGLFSGLSRAPRAQPFPLANRARCSDAADWQCNPAGAGRGFIRIVYFISQFPIPNSQFPIPNSQFPIPNSLFPFPFFISRCPVSWTAPFHLPGPFHEPPHMYYVRSTVGRSTMPYGNLPAQK